MHRPEQEKIRAITGTDLKSSFSCGAWSSKACVRGHDRSLPHLVNRAQTSNKAHDKFVPRRDCACADRSRPSLSTALLGGWSSHLVLIGFRLTAPLSQAPSLGQDELTRRKCNLDTRGLTVRLHTLHNRAQTSNKAHDKFVPLRDCACADHLRPSLSPALLSGWSSHLVNPYTFAQSID